MNTKPFSLPARLRTLHLSLAEGIVIITYSAVVVFTTLQVIFRYAIGSSLPWTEELARYSFMWLIYTSMVLGLNKGAHASLNLLLDKCTGVSKFLVTLCIHILTISLFMVLLYHGTKLFLMVQGQSSPATRISMMFPYASLPFGCLLMLIEEFFLWRATFRKGAEPQAELPSDAVLRGGA